MEIVITSSAREAAITAADAFERLLSGTGRPVIGLATGGSPLPTYRELIERCRAGRVSFARTRMFLLDEYVGLDPGHPMSCRNFIQRELLDHVDVPEGALAVPECASEDPATAGEAYERRITDAGGIDLQVLGIGRNGHIGFNEPPSSLASRTRLTALAAATRKDNARFFGDAPDLVPRQGITQGIGTILEARHIVLIATDEAKRRGGRQGCGGTGDCDDACIRPTATQPHHGDRRRGRRPATETRRLLPRGIPQ